MTPSPPELCILQAFTDLKASWSDVGSAALVLLAVHWLHQTDRAVGMQMCQLSLKPKVVPGMVRRKSSPLTTRWSMASSATFAIVWNPRIWYTWRHQSDPLHDLDLRPYTRLPITRVAAEDDPQKYVVRLAPCPHLRLRDLEFSWILWCAPGYLNSKTCLPKVLLTLLPSLSTQRRYYQAMERPTCLTSLLCP